MSRRASGAVNEAIRTVAAATEPTDQELLARFCEGDEAAFAALVRRHSPMVLGVCKRLLPTEQDAEDACQAVFVVLARKAKDRWRASVANWLYGTARRVALKAHRAAARRAKREAQAAPLAAVSLLDQMTGREAFAALDEELDKLAPTYREPLVLCYLQGLTRDEAATRLGVPAATVKSQLERGKKKLGDALTRRGIVPGAALLAAAATSTARAVSPVLTQSILASAGGSPSAAVAALAQEVVVTKWIKGVTLPLLALIGLAVASQGAADKPAAEKPKPAEAPAVVRGTVVGPDGKPVAGATVWLCHNAGEISPTRPAPIAAATSDENGRFVIEKKDAGKRLSWYTFAATKSGYGPGVGLATGKKDELRCSLRLAKDDVPITGRVLDLQGRPVAGATVRPTALHCPADNLDEWEKAARRSTKEAAGGYNKFFPQSLRLKDGPVAGIAAEVKTDRDGKFTLTGMGRDRLVTLQVSGPGLATDEFEVISRHMATIRTPADKLESQWSPRVYHGATFDRTAEPSQPFEGVVIDKETGKPVPGVVVQSRFGWPRPEAVTGPDGKYKLDGLRTGEQRLIAIPPIDAPYFLREFRAGRAANQLPVTANVELHRGVWVSGTVTDKKTGQPVEASISFRPYTYDTEAEKIPGYQPRGLDDISWYVSDAAGKFRVLAVPGRGYIFLRAWSGRYLTADQTDWQGDVAKPDPKEMTTSSPVDLAVNYNAIGMVTVRNGKPAKEYAFTVDPGETVKCRVLDAEGKPLAGARVSGRESRVTGAEVEFERVSPKWPRVALVLHAEKRLGAVARAAAGDIRLKPTATAAGRLLTEDGPPMPLTPIEVRHRLGEQAGWRTSPLFPDVMTDAEGKFVIANLIEGLQYELRWPRPSPRKANGYHGFTIKSGEQKHLGDIGTREDSE